LAPQKKFSILWHCAFLVALQQLGMTGKAPFVLTILDGRRVDDADVTGRGDRTNRQCSTRLILRYSFGH
jgi:hypothetical protein